MASIAHMNAINHWNKFNRADALGQIYRAIKLETKEYLLPKHLLLKGEIEWALGRHQESFSSLKEAEELVEKYSDYWSKPSNKICKNRLNEALQKHV